MRSKKLIEELDKKRTVVEWRPRSLVCQGGIFRCNVRELDRSWRKVPIKGGPHVVRLRNSRRASSWLDRRTQRPVRQRASALRCGPSRPGPLLNPLREEHMQQAREAVSR
jgi:hypothetical protein